MLSPGYGTGQVVTADLAVGTSGQPTVIWSVDVIGGTSAQVTIRNGTGTGDPAVWGPNAAYTPSTTSPPVGFSFPNGLFCPAGAFADVAGTSPVVSITYSQQSPS